MEANLTGRALKVELAGQPWPGRHWITQVGERVRTITEASLSVVFARFSRWLVAPAKAPESGPLLAEPTGVKRN